MKKIYEPAKSHRAETKLEKYRIDTWVFIVFMAIVFIVAHT